MLKKFFSILIISISLFKVGFSQEIKNMKDINVVWEKFCKAFETYNNQLFGEIHSKNLIRIPNGKKIVAYENYIKSDNVNTKENKNENSTRAIYLRFFERVNNDSIASERGIYKVVRHQGTPNEKTSYGKFHVLLIKENGEWRIFMDYDNKEGGTINEEDFNNAYDMADFNRFVNE